MTDISDRTASSRISAQRMAIVHGAGARITDSEAAALVRATVGLFRAWSLSESEARAVLGGLSERELEELKTGDTGAAIDPDLRVRMALLMGVHVALRTIFTDPARGYAWIRKPSSELDGRSALDIMMRGGIPDMAELRDYLEAVAGGPGADL